MPYSTTLQNIAEALRLAPKDEPIPTRALTRIESELMDLGEFPGIIGEMVTEFREAMTWLKMKRESGNVHSILLASAHVHEVWDTLAPALEKLAAEMPRKYAGE